MCDALRVHLHIHAYMSVRMWAGKRVRIHVHMNTFLHVWLSRATEAHFDTHIHTCTQATVAPMIGLPAEYTPPKPHVTVPRRI